MSKMTDIVLLAEHEEAVHECVVNIRLATEEPYRLIVVVAEEQVELLSWLRQNKQVHVVPARSGYSVAEGYNLGLKEARSPFVVLMREHMYVTEGWLPRLSQCLEANESAAAAGPVSHGLSGVQHCSLNTDNTSAMIHYAEGVGIHYRNEYIRVTRLLGHLIMVRLEAMRQLGGFDERFQGESFEDDDWSYRALLGGYDLYVAKDCYIRYERHYGPFADNPGAYQEQIRRNGGIAEEKWGFRIDPVLDQWRWPVTISLCMIVRDEEQTLERCLSSVAHIVDEIVIVDTGSNDRTKEIAGKFTGNVLDFQWIDDFAAARNYAFGQATQQYILWLDADDVVSAEDGEKLLALKNSMAWYTDAVSMNYQLAFDQSGRAVSSLRRNRLVKRSNGYRWVGAVHEYLEVFGRIQHSDIGVAHQRMHKQSSRNLSIYDNMVRDGKPFSARDLYYYANELMDHSLWERALGRYDEFLERGEGWIEDRLQACGKASECLCQLGRVQEAKEKALKAFTLAIPRAEICCRLGYYELEAGQYEHAVYWYKLALSLDKPLDPMAMLNESCWTWLPHLQLCVCYHKLGRNGLAANHNEAAAGYVPEHEAVRRNQQYFQQLNA